MPSNRAASKTLESPTSTSVGVGLKAQHYQDVLSNSPDIGWFEVHAENYMGAGGPSHEYLEAIRENYPLSLHGVGLSLGSAGSLSTDHLKRLRALNDRYAPFVISEHVSWSVAGGTFLNDLLPLPYTQESLGCIADNVLHTQDFLGRQILVENPSTYLQFEQDAYSEPEFLAALVSRTGCGLLLDINNVFVCASNHGFDAWQYLENFPHDHVQEIHLAGHAVDRFDGHDIRIDDHGSHVCDHVWSLYARYIEAYGPASTLIEWDRNIPSWNVLQAEADRAKELLATTPVMEMPSARAS